jgi:peptidase E
VTRLITQKLVKPRMNVALTSDWPSTTTLEVSDFMRKGHPSPLIAWIPPYTKSGHKHFPAAQQAFAAHGFTKLEYCDIDQAPDAAQLEGLAHYDIVYLAGGDPIGFRRNILRTGLPARLQECLAAGCQVVTASGGTMQLTRNVSLFRLLNNSLNEVIADHSEYEALGIVTFEILPHLNRFEPSFLELVQRYSERLDYDVVALADGAALLCKDSDNYTCIGRVVRFRKGIASEIGRAV